MPHSPHASLARTILIAAFIFLAGCSALSPGAGSLPTLYLIPTLTPSPQAPPRNALPPSWTPSVEPGRSPTVTRAPSATPSPTSTITLPPTVTPTRTPIPPTAPPPPPPLQNIRLTLQPVINRLKEPSALADARDIPGRLYIVERYGRILILQNGVLLAFPFLDISQRVSPGISEDGLLGLAFHPNYASNGYFYVYYVNRSRQSVLSRFSVTSNPDVADPTSETIMLTFDQPTLEHNGGGLTFGPDGYLYLGLGDGGGIGDEYHNAQNGGTVLGSILRLDVDGGSPYGIPPGNPFVGDPNFRDEIWAYGLRNPWRIAFDRATGDLYIADVGETHYEEIDFIPAGTKGQNFGWPQLEGLHCYSGGQPCQHPGMTPPVFEYSRADGCAIIGGYVYRGQQSPALNGTYLYSDFCEGVIWGLRRTAGGWQQAELFNSALIPSAFGQDRDGEVYVFDFYEGDLYKITATAR